MKRADLELSYPETCPTHHPNHIFDEKTHVFKMRFLDLNLIESLIDVSNIILKNIHLKQNPGLLWTWNMYKMHYHMYKKLRNATKPGFHFNY